MATNPFGKLKIRQELTILFLGIGLAPTLVVGGYTISSLAGLVHWLETPAKFMPYHYYDTVGLLSGHVGWNLIAYLIGTSAIAAVIGTIGYMRRDIG